MKKIAISLLALTLAVFLAAPAMAEFEPYGSLRLSTYWVTQQPADPGVDDDSDLWFEVDDISRFGARFKTGDLGGRVEFGLKGDGHGDNGVYTRLLYGTWDFGGGTLLVGQDYPEYTFISDQVAPRTLVTNTNSGNPHVIDGENAMYGYGCLWESRKPQIEIKMDNGFYVELLRPERDDGGPNNAPAGGDADTTLPKIVVGYDLNMENLFLGPGFAYNSYDYKSGAFDEAVTSYLIYLKGKLGLGMANLQWNVHYGQNLVDFDIWNREAAAAAAMDVNTGDLEDSQCYGGYLQVGFKVDPATITLGYGYAQSENDVLGDDADQQQSYFAQCRVPIADTFFVVPEVSFYDGMDDAAGNEEDDEWAVGLLWRMDF